MPELLRRAGRGRAANGDEVLWSLAEGRRGRRWRISRMRDEGLISATLLELDEEGRFSRLEITSPAGSLTLHPEADGASVHGNIVTWDGMHHVAESWSAEHLLVVAGQPIATGLAVVPLVDVIGVGESVVTPVALVDDGLQVRAARGRWTRGDASRWSVEVEGVNERFELDERGLPSGFDDAEEWPLEID